MLPLPRPILRRLEELGVKASIRMARSKVGPVVTDNGNLIIDADFGPVENPKELEERLKAIPGIVETGLFIGYVDLAYIGTKSGVRRLKAK